MSSDPRFDLAWQQLEPAFRRCIELAWDSLQARGLPVGSVVTDASAARIGEGRNRAYDPPGGTDALQQSPIAHAEMNALAQVRLDIDRETCVIWSTQEPCSMCRAAVQFAGLGSVRFLATDPSSFDANDGALYRGDAGEAWAMVANVLFLHNIALVSGLENPMLRDNRRFEPETVSVALEILAEGLFVGSDHPSGVHSALSSLWNRIEDATARRSERVGS